MKKYIYTIAAILCFHFASFSQSHYVFIDFKDAQKPGVQTEFTYPEKTVNTAIDDRMKKMGYKNKDVKGYAMYQGVTLPELGPQSYDLYFRVDKKSKKDKDNSVVTMLVSSGNENFITDSDSTTMNNAKKFLDNLMPSVAAYDLQQQINAQQDEVKKAEKKYKSLQSDGEDLQKRKKKIEEQIVDNANDQKNQSAEVEKQHQVLNALMARQK